MSTFRTASFAKGCRELLNKIPINVYVLTALVVFFGLITRRGTFFSVANFMNIIAQSVVLAIVAVAACLALISKGVDLSLGMIMSMSGVIAAQLSSEMGWPLPLVFAVSILSGTLIGMLNGLIISTHRIAPFIVTLATSNIARSLAYLFSGIRTVRAMDPAFRWIGSAFVFRIVPVGIFVVLVVFALANYLMTKRKLGTYIYAVGCNEVVAKLSGINVARVKFLTYTMTGTLGALAGIMLTSRMGAANPAQGQGFEFYGIASAVVGGVSMFGGRGSVWKTLSGTLIIAILRNGLNMANMPASYQMITLGIVVVGVVAADTWLRKEA